VISTLLSLLAGLPGAVLSLLAAVPWRVLVVIGLLAGLVGTHLWLEGRAVDAAIAQHNAAALLRESEAATARIAAALETDREARRMESARRRNMEANERERVQRESRLRVAVAGARSELDGLRADLAARAAAAGSEAGGDGTAAARRDEAAAVERELFGACAGRYEGMAREAGELAGQVIELQSYVTGVCRADLSNPQGEP
jgi:hypothetical protein